MIPTRCTISTWDYCPAGGRHRSKRTRPPRLCGQLHPNPEPWAGLTVDDVAECLPAGELVAMRDLLGDVRLVSPADLELFQEMTEQTGEYQPGQPTQAQRSARAPHGHLPQPRPSPRRGTTLRQVRVAPARTRRCPVPGVPADAGRPTRQRLLRPAPTPLTSV
jgi:hypothetical protein